MSISEKLLNLQSSIVVAIDGTSASGKGTLAKLMAERFNLTYCQTSLFYRGLALKACQNNIGDSIMDLIELSKQPLDITDSAELYTPKVTETASQIAAIPEIRENLLKPQKDFLASHKRIVMEGRDIGTVIAPDADLKLFITADLKVRAERRRQQMLENGVDVTVEEVMDAIEERDKRDSSRISAPLLKAQDAIAIDTTNNSPDDIIESLLKRG